jgi:arsenate reductase
VELRQDGQLPLEALPPLITVARRFERVSDLATNICEEALYFATGEYVRHLALEGFRVVFADETNGCLSRMAEAIANGLHAERFSFASAGIEAGPVDPQTVRFLAEKGIEVSRQPSRALSEIPNLEQVQVIVALCKETDRIIPKRPSKTVGMDWAIADPSQARGTPDHVHAAFEQTYDTLTHNIRDLVQAILGNDERPHNGQASRPL